MNNDQFLALKEFRRFVNSHIYPQLAPVFISPAIVEQFNIDKLEYQATPQAMIKFNYGLEDKNILAKSAMTMKAHIILKGIFVRFFNLPEVEKDIRHKIYISQESEETKQLLYLALSEIKSGNQQYLCLLFNITFLNDNSIYLYL